MSEVVYYRDASENRLWRYRIVANNNEIVHASHRGWEFKADAGFHLWAETMAFAELVWAPGLPEKAYADGSDYTQDNLSLRIKETDEWRWWIHLDTMGPTLITLSHEGFKTRVGCIRNLLVNAKILVPGNYTTRVVEA